LKLVYFPLLAASFNPSQILEDKMSRAKVCMKLQGIQTHHL